MRVSAEPRDCVVQRVRACTGPVAVRLQYECGRPVVTPGGWVDPGKLLLGRAPRVLRPRDFLLGPIVVFDGASHGLPISARGPHAARPLRPLDEPTPHTCRRSFATWRQSEANRR